MLKSKLSNSLMNRVRKSSANNSQLYGTNRNTMRKQKHIEQFWMRNMGNRIFKHPLELPNNKYSIIPDLLGFPILRRPLITLDKDQKMTVAITRWEIFPDFSAQRRIINLALPMKKLDL